MTIISVVPNGGWTEFRRAYDSAAAEDSGTSDLIELLDTIDVPIVVVRQDFRIASFNRAAADVLALAPSDVGRPACAIPVLSHLAPTCGYRRPIARSMRCLMSLASQYRGSCSRSSAIVLLTSPDYARSCKRR